jgi:hypothetical protein
VFWESDLRRQDIQKFKRDRTKLVQRLAAQPDPVADQDQLRKRMPRQTEAGSPEEERITLRWRILSLLGILENLGQGMGGESVPRPG